MVTISPARRTEVFKEFRRGAHMITGTLATVVFLVATVLAAVLALRVVFTLLGTNASNEIVQNVTSWSKSLAGPLGDLFSFSKPKRTTVVNFSVAALVYLVAGQMISSLLKKI